MLSHQAIQLAEETLAALVERRGGKLSYQATLNASSGISTTGMPRESTGLPFQTPPEIGILGVPF